MKYSKATLDALKRAAPLDEIVRRDGVALDLVEGRLVGRCPFHDDDSPSFDVAPEKDGGVYLCRSANCGKHGDVFTYVRERRGLSFPAAVQALAGDVGFALRVEGGRELVASYDYTDAIGTVLYRIERWEPGKGNRSKDFLQRLADGTYKKSSQQVLYRLPEVVAAVKAGATVYVVEGEKCAEVLRGTGVAATTHAGGAKVAKKTWTPSFAAALKGARVVVLPDNDEGGRAAAGEVAEVLAGVAAEVRVVHLPLEGKGADIVDWLKAGHTREELEVLAAATLPLPAVDADEWRELLACGRDGPKGSVGNVLMVLESDVRTKAVVAFDEHAREVMVMRQPPWRSAGLYPRPFGDNDATWATQWVEQEHDVSSSVETVGRALHAVAAQYGFNPLLDYLNGLVWDGKPRLDAWLTTYLHAKDEPLTRAVGRKWVISAVARAMKPGSQVDHVLTLEGAQGLMKSSALRAFAGDRWFSDELPEMGSKDAALAVGKGWIVELAELDALKKSETTRVKAFLVRRVDRFRPPYGRHAIDVPRACVFAATTNDATYLRDTTGNRRFWPVRVGGPADVAGLHRDRDQLWAEAVAAFKGGEPWFLADEDLIAQANEVQEERLEVDPWETKIARWVIGQEWVTTNDALDAVGVELAKRQKGDANRVGALLRRAGFQHRLRAPRLEDATRGWRFYREPPVHGRPPTPGGGGGGGGPEVVPRASDTTNRGTSGTTHTDALGPTGPAGTPIQQLFPLVVPSPTGVPPPGGASPPTEMIQESRRTSGTSGTEPGAMRWPTGPTTTAEPDDRGTSDPDPLAYVDEAIPGVTATTELMDPDALVEAFQELAAKLEEANAWDRDKAWKQAWAQMVKQHGPAAMNLAKWRMP